MSKAEKIRKEIERLKAETFDNKELSLEEIIAVRNCYNNLLFFIDSLEQPIKRTPAEIEAAMQEVEEKSKLFTEAHKDDVVSNDTIDDLEEAAWTYYDKNKPLISHELDLHKEMISFFIAGAQWQKDHTCLVGRAKTIEEIKEALLSEVLPCFMHGGEADEVVAKLDEVLNKKIEE